jgi:hypothetical protein
MTTDTFLKPNPSSTKIDKNACPNLSKIMHLIENFGIRKFYELTANEGERDNYGVTDNIIYRLYVAESQRHKCCKLQIKISGEEINALTGIGCEISILNEYLYNKLRHAELKMSGATDSTC